MQKYEIFAKVNYYMGNMGFFLSEDMQEMGGLHLALSQYCPSRRPGDRRRRRRRGST